jgi:hypothetical protein
MTDTLDATDAYFETSDARLMHVTPLDIVL